MAKRDQNSQEKEAKQMPLPTLATARDRHCVSDRAIASFATAVLLDMLIIIQSNKGQAIDQSKVRRERHIKLEDLTNSTTFCGSYFDSRKNQSMVQKKKANCKLHR